MFITPKTDWSEGTYFNLYPDYFRIKNNILELQKVLSRLYRPFEVIDMRDYGIGENEFVGFADFFNCIERNIDILADHGFRNPKLPATAVWQADRPAWSYHDLNRVEGSLGILFHDIMTQIENQMTISFLLGGEDFE